MFDRIVVNQFEHLYTTGSISCNRQVNFRIIGMNYRSAALLTIQMGTLSRHYSIGNVSHFILMMLLITSAAVINAAWGVLILICAVAGFETLTILNT